MPATTKAQVRQVASDLYDKGTTDLGTLTSAVARAVGPGAALFAGVAAWDVISSKGKSIADTVTGGAASAVSDAAGVVRDAVELPTRILRWLGEPGTWIRIAYVIGGGSLILIGAAMLLKGPATATVATVSSVKKSVGG